MRFKILIKMDIEITTTKKKLSKSLINQMTEISFNELDGSTCLGYVIGAAKGSHRALLVVTNEKKYRIMRTSWILSDSGTYLRRKISRGFTQTWDFKNKEATVWHDKMLQFNKDANQIYI